MKQSHTETVRGLRSKLAELDQKREAIERDRRVLLRSIQILDDGIPSTGDLSLFNEDNPPERPYDAIRMVIKAIEGPFSLKDVRDGMAKKFPKMFDNLKPNIISGALYQLCKNGELRRVPARSDGMKLYEGTA